MVERDVVLAKVATIDRCLRRIEEVRDPGRGLDPRDAEDIVELDLLRAVQAAVDLAGHVVATEELGLPAKLAENFTLLERQGLISPDLADQLRRMAGFRNVAVDEYVDVDPGRSCVANRSAPSAAKNQEEVAPGREARGQVQAPRARFQTS